MLWKILSDRLGMENTLKNLTFEVASVVSDSVTPCGPPGSSVHGISQARILEWIAIPSTRGSFPPRDQTQVSYISCIGRQVLYH